MANVELIADLFAEQQMARLGVVWKVEIVDLFKVNWDDFREINLARMEPVDEAHVDELAISASNGDKLPRPVLRKKEDGSFDVVSGHHRMPAFKKLGVKSIAAYVFKSNDEFVINTLPRICNPSVKEVPRATRLVFAREAVKLGCNYARAGEIYGFSPKVVRDHVVTEDLKEELVFQMGIAGAKHLNVGVLDALARIRDRDVLRAATNLVCMAGMNVDETRSLMNDLKKERTVAAQLQVVGSQQKITGLDAVGSKASPIFKKSTRKKSSISTITKAISTLEKHANASTINRWGVTDRIEKGKLIGRLERLYRALRSLCERSK